MQPYLSICIPTFNRAAFLEKLLVNLDVCQGHFPEIELVISDNASEDNTGMVCRRYADKLHYFRNEQNIGFDRNYLQCIAKARGEYVWIVGDDDVVDLALVRGVLAELKKSTPSMLVINGGNRVKEQGPTRHCERFDDFFGKYGWHFTWISTTILKRSVIVSLDDVQMKSSRNFVHISMIIKSFFCRENFVFCPELVVRDGDNVPAYARDLSNVVKLFAHDLCCIVDLYPACISAKAGNSFLVGHYRHLNLFNLKFFANARKSKSFTKEFFQENKNYLARAIGGDRLTMQLAEFSFLVPPVIFKILVKLLRIFNIK